MVFDTILRGGTVMDGSGKAGFRADVGMLDGKIAAVGNLTDARARRILDVTGRLVTPGFIDIHRHADAAIFRPGFGDAELCQGLTTIINGNCGLSAAPSGGAYQAEIFDYLTPVTGPLEARMQTDSMGTYLQAAKALALPVNVGMLAGVGKTTMALAFSRALGLDYGRVQFTPDVLPSDITGYSIFDKESGTMRYQPGVILCNLFLADELNRATSRTQSALLEAMEEGQVTVDGVSHRIPEPFCVFATQNPTGASGTQLLPDSQMDRFAVRLSIGYPAPEDERNMVLARQGVNPLQTVCQVLSRDELIAMQDEAAAVYIKTELIDYIIALIDATRKHPMILRGASPRATLSLTAMAKAVAYVQRRDYVVPKDIQVTFPQVIAHRLLLAPEAGARQITPEQLLDEILHQVPSPRL